MVNTCSTHRLPSRKTVAFAGAAICLSNPDLLRREQANMQAKQPKQSKANLVDVVPMLIVPVLPKRLRRQKKKNVTGARRRKHKRKM